MLENEIDQEKKYEFLRVYSKNQPDKFLDWVIYLEWTIPDFRFFAYALNTVNCRCSAEDSYYEGEKYLRELIQEETDLYFKYPKHIDIYKYYHNWLKKNKFSKKEK